MHAVETLPVDGWVGPFTADVQRRAVAALESGCVLFLPRLDFDLDAADRDFLIAVAGDDSSKNISFDPARGECACKGARLSNDEMLRLSAVMARFADQAAALLHALAPGYGPGLERARMSFRPTEIAGRNLPWRKDDRRLHVDAFPSCPARGRRILRVFSNIDPSGTPRRWHIGEPFEDHASRFLPRVSRPLPGSGTLLSLFGLTKGPRSRYDHLMLGLHDAAKSDPGYQADAPREVFDFPAGSTWVAYTDQVPHAAMSGRCAFEQTFHVDPAVMADPARAPVRVLQRLTRRALV